MGNIFIVFTDMSNVAICAEDATLFLPLVDESGNDRLLNLSLTKIYKRNRKHNFFCLITYRYLSRLCGVHSRKVCLDTEISNGI
jgi:hypothetical protein